MKLTNHKLREISLQLLYAMEAGAEDVDSAIPLVMKLLSISRKNVYQARDLAKNVLKCAVEIDEEISSRTAEYTLSRISFMERNILRIVMYEAKHADLPIAVCIAEANRLCKKFSTPEAGKFVHGILSEWENGQTVASTV